jgi:uncharacterized protein (DUF1330 family)
MALFCRRNRVRSHEDSADARRPVDLGARAHGTLALHIHRKTALMPAYVIVEVDIHDPANYERYKALVPPTIAAYGGRYLARGGQVESLEGDWNPRRVVILEFPSVERARAWWAAPEAEQIKALRQSSARTKMIVVEGM